ncbi:MULTISPECIES: hypothetical protein [Pectobacterium]|uniref:hypothetical protein n=1 Tax=Pectobacterium TaxID=122277 RepID=UPI001CD721A9|nr:MULTISPECIES: hypothetical protein [Pectobacterium]
MKMTALRSKARRNALDVEHILAAAKVGLSGFRDELNRLSAEFSWSHSPYLPDGTHVVPLAKWADVAGVYADEGIATQGKRVPVATLFLATMKICRTMTRCWSGKVFWLRR